MDTSKETTTNEVGSGVPATTDSNVESDAVASVSELESTAASESEVESGASDSELESGASDLEEHEVTVPGFFHGGSLRFTRDTTEEEVGAFFMGNIPPFIQELMAFKAELFKPVKLEELCARKVPLTRQQAFRILSLAFGTRNKTLMDKVECFLWEQIATSGPADGPIWLREFLDQFRQKRPMEFLEFVDRNNFDYTFHRNFPLAPARLTVQCLKANMEGANLYMAKDPKNFMETCLDLLDKGQGHAWCGNQTRQPCARCTRKDLSFLIKTLKQA